jgi:hydrogenase maturation protease
MTRKVADAVLYEGYLLYPYRPSAIKNRHRWNFGVLYPRAYAEAQRGADRWRVRAEVLVTGRPEVEVVLRYMEVSSSSPVAREIVLQAPEVHTTQLADTLWKLTVDVENRAPYDGSPDDRDAALALSFASAHLVLTASEGTFVSLLDPPAELAEAAAGCHSEGLYPVLMGERSMLASPIILYDHPRIAPESRGDLFDGTEIDEILSLRIMTLTDEEKREAAAGDARARQLIERTDALTAGDLMAMHGTMRGLRPGSRVRLHPKRGADIMDIALAGKTAVVDAIESDFDDRIHVAVIVDDDPGRDLGLFGHRFFFSPEEVEPL